MASYATYRSHNSSHRASAMVLALTSALILSPLYVKRRDYSGYYETRWSSGFVLPVILAGLIIAIRTTSLERGGRGSVIPSPDPSWVLRIGNSSWGLAGILILLLLVLSCQESVHEFFWR